MNKKCQNCSLVNYESAQRCLRCDAELVAVVSRTRAPKSRLLRFAVRAAVCSCVCLAAIVGFYLTLIGSAKSLSVDQKSTVRSAIKVLKDAGFSTETTLLENITAFRGNDNWLNASVPKENAYAATNFPFEIMTLYPDFFTYPADDVERAAILLHEARHLRGEDEHDAYAFVWKNRKRFGWTRDKYFLSPVWANIRRQTLDNVPELFTCEANELADCTE